MRDVASRCWQCRCHPCASSDADPLKRRVPRLPPGRLRQLLGLPADRETFEVVYTLSDPKHGQIAIRTRSLTEVLSELAGDTDVPVITIPTG